MSTYTPPIQDIHFLLKHVFDFQHDDLDDETIDAILEEAGKLARDVLAPLNHSGDQEGASLEDGELKTASGFQDAYAQYRDGGWNAVPFDPAYGGQGLPYAIAFPIQEMWQAANMSFGLCPLLNQGAVEAILSHGSDEQKGYYLSKLISGEWTGTMNLTEPQAGSDLGLLRSKAEPNDDGSYAVTGQKIYITYGEHDLAENIIHLVLARLPDAPEDSKGISLFIVPKFLENGTRNAVNCIGLEHKLGIHASPTCTMDFDGATGYLLGAEHQGLKCMFTMMNNARLSVGLQGVAIADRAYQHAQIYAADRIQGKSLSTGERISIDGHADVKRILLTMQSYIEAGRALTYEAAFALDDAHTGDQSAQALVDLLTPIVKSWCTDMACEVTSLGVQIHGGMGFIEETGAAQYYRDARILPIYEGTNGIQALDLVFRKTLRDGGKSIDAYITLMQSRLSETPPETQEAFEQPLEQLQAAKTFLVEQGQAGHLEICAAAASPFLKAMGILAGGALLAYSAHQSQTIDDTEFARYKQKAASFYLHNILPLAHGHLHAATFGSQHV